MITLIEKNTYIEKMNDFLNDYYGWSFEYDDDENAYCLSLFDPRNPADELVFFISQVDKNIYAASRYKSDGAVRDVRSEHKFYLEAKDIVSAAKKAGIL